MSVNILTMKNDILFIGGTHGDEPLGVEVLKDLENKAGRFDWIVGSPPALQAGTREFEGDLNRSAPGDPQASGYAIRRAAEIVELAKDYRWVIDLHGTRAYTGIFIIITKPTRANLELALRFDIRNIVLWPSFSGELCGPLSESVSCGIEIECGPKDMPLVRSKLSAVLERFIERADGTIDPESLEDILHGRNFFEVYGSLKSGVAADSLGEFIETEVEGERFLPLLIGRYQERNGILCYKMRPLLDPISRFKT